MTYPQQTWALIKDGVIVNTVLCGDDAPNLFGDDGWDQIIDITNYHVTTTQALATPGTKTKVSGHQTIPIFCVDDSEGAYVEPVAKPDDVEGKVLAHGMKNQRPGSNTTFRRNNGHSNH
jgi:hypothetical protein